MNQIAMAGDDWQSDRDRKNTAKRKAAKAKAQAACAKALHGAVSAIQDYVRACNECGDGSGTLKNGASDSRLRLIEDLKEYASWLDR